MGLVAGCGKTTFTAVAANTGTSTASVILTAVGGGTTGFYPGRVCEVTISTGLTSPNTGEAANLAGRKAP